MWGAALRKSVGSQEGPWKGERGTPGTPVACRALSSSWESALSGAPVGFHMVELPGAATVGAMSCPEHEETEEARGEASSQSELTASGPVPSVGGQVPFSQLFVPGGMQTIPFLPVGGRVTSSGYVFGASMSPGMILEDFRSRWVLLSVAGAGT